MKQSKTQLKKSQEYTIKLIGFFLAVVLLATFAITSGAMNLSASVVRPAVRTETKHPTKPAIPAPTTSCKDKCIQNKKRCDLSQEGAMNCNYFYDRCVSACTK